MGGSAEIVGGAEGYQHRAAFLYLLWKPWFARATVTKSGGAPVSGARFPDRGGRKNTRVRAQGMTMQVRFSTDDLQPRDRVRFWCDHIAKLAHSITPDKFPILTPFAPKWTDTLQANLRCSRSSRASRGSAALALTSPRTRPMRSSSADSAGRWFGERPPAVRRLISSTKPVIFV